MAIFDLAAKKIAWTTDQILGNDIDLDATVQPVGNVVIGSRIYVNEPSNRRVFISGGDAALPLTSVYSDGVNANVTYFTSTQGNGLHLVGRDELHFASENTIFDDSRPRCSESTYPTTNADDLASKEYVDNRTTMHFNSASINTNNGDFLQANGSNTNIDFCTWVMGKTTANVRIRAFLTTAPGGVETDTFTVYKNGVATAATLAITGANTSGESTTTVAFAPGDRFALEFTKTGGAAGTTEIVEVVLN